MIRVAIVPTTHTFFSFKVDVGIYDGFRPVSDRVKGPLEHPATVLAVPICSTIGNRANEYSIVKRPSNIHP